MPEQYDPKGSPRPPNDRRAGDVRRGVENDPLAELAKIVQGRPTAHAAPAPKTPARGQMNGSPDTHADLEAELLSDLQASFAAVREALPPVSSPPKPQVAQPRTVATEPPVMPDRAPPPAAMPPRAEARSELREEFRPEPFDEGRLTPIPAPPVIQPTIQSSFEPASRAASPPPRPIVERAAEKVERAPETPPERPKPIRTPSAEPRMDLGAFQMRGSAAPPSPSKQPHSRWERPEPAPRPQPAHASRFAPPRVTEAGAEDLEVDPFAEGGLFAEQLTQTDTEEEFPLDDLGTIGNFADDEHLPPLDDDIPTLVRRRRPNRNLLLVGAVVAVAVVGGVAFAMLNRGQPAATGDIPVIAADNSPTKITPADTSATPDTDSQNKLIYDRVNSGTAAANTDTTLVTPSDDQIKDVGSADSDNPISRVIIPGGPGIDRPTASGGGTAAAPEAGSQTAQADTPPAASADDAASGSGEDAIGPRKVRTVVVKPDGTILSAKAADADAAAANKTSTAPADTADNPAATAAAPANNNQPAPTVTDDMAAIAGNTDGALPLTPSDDATASSSAPPPADTKPVASDNLGTDDAVVATKPAPARTSTKPAATNQVAANDASPIDLTPGTQPAAATAGGTLVQISSQRTEDAARATYRDLQARYPNILGKYDVNIQRADVPDRGTFYRVRVGPFSQGDAQHLCDDLRSAGGDCVLAKR